MEVSKALTIFIEKGYITLKQFNRRLSNFEFADSMVNKPDKVCVNHLTNKKLQWTGSEMLHFIHIFPFLIGDLIPPDEPYWRLLLLLRKITSRVLRKKIVKGENKILRDLVEEHHTLYVEELGETLTQKLHGMLHYDQDELVFGPLWHICAIRSEAKHFRYKILKMQCKKNIVQTIATSAALDLIKLNYPLTKEVKQRKRSEFLLKSKYDVNISSAIRELGPNLKNVQYIYLEYEKAFRGMVISLGLDDNLMLKIFKIEEIFETQESKIFLIIQEMFNFGLHDHYDAILVQETQDYQLIDLEDIISKNNLRLGAMFSGFDGKKFIDID